MWARVPMDQLLEVEQLGQRATSFAVFMNVVKQTLHRPVAPQLCSWVPASAQSIPWKWYLSLVLSYTVPTVNSVKHLFNRIHFPSCIKWCFIKLQAIIHYLASFFTVRLVYTWESQAWRLPLLKGLLHRSWEEKQDPRDAGTWVTPLLHYHPSEPQQEPEHFSVSSSKWQ